MRNVWTYTLKLDALSVGFTQVLRVPKDAFFLCGREHNGDYKMWFEFDESNAEELVERKYQVFGTGHGGIREGLTYVGTGVYYSDTLVLHIYEVTDGS